MKPRCAPHAEVSSGGSAGGGHPSKGNMEIIIIINTILRALVSRAIRGGPKPEHASSLLL